MRPKAPTDRGQYPEFPAAAPVGAERSETGHVLRTMAAALARRRPATTAEALQVLRRGYPDIPLAMRIAAMCADGK